MTDFNLKKRDTLLLAIESADVIKAICTNNLSFGFDETLMLRICQQADRIKNLMQLWKELKE